MIAYYHDVVKFSKTPSVKLPEGRTDKKSHTVSAELEPISQTVSGISEILMREFPLSWSHYCLLVRLDEPFKKEFYEAECIRGNWPVRQLDRQIQSMLYERTALSKRKLAVIAKAHERPIILKPEDEIKDLCKRIAVAIRSQGQEYFMGLLLGHDEFTVTFSYPETVYTITSATTKPTREFEALGKIYRYYKIKKEAFLGYEPKRVDGVTVLIAEPEKALVDYLYFVSLKKRALNERLITKNLKRRKVLEYSEAFKREGLRRLMEKIL